MLAALLSFLSFLQIHGPIINYLYVMDHDEEKIKERSVCALAPQSLGHRQYLLIFVYLNILRWRCPKDLRRLSAQLLEGYDWQCVALSL